MSELNIASKANQATTFPALLVASYVNETDPKHQVTVSFEEVEALQSSGDATVELSVNSSIPKQGTEQVIEQLFEMHPLLHGTKPERVCLW